MPVKTKDELANDRNNLLRNDAAANSIDPEEVRGLLTDMTDTEFSSISGVNASIANVQVMTQGAQTDATAALSQADRAEKTAESATQIADRAATAANEAKTSAEGADTKANTATTTANTARTAANTAQNRANEAHTIAIGNRGGINQLFNRADDIDREIVGVKNSIEELEVPDTYDWAETGNNDPIPDNKLVNAPAKPDTTARTTATNAFNIASQNNIRLNRLPVFGNAQLHPSGIRGKRFPKYMALDLSNKIDQRTIAEIRIVSQGVTINVTSTGQRELLNQINSHGGIINIVMQDTDIDEIAANLNNTQQDVQFQLQYKFGSTNLGTGTPADEIDRVHFGVNNDSFAHQPEFIGSSNFNVTGNNRFTAGDSAIILPRIGFGLINLGRRRAADPMDLTHHVVNFTTITGLTAAANNASVTAANHGIISIARSYFVGRTNGNRLLIASANTNTDASPVTVYRY